MSECDSEYVHPMFINSRIFFDSTSYKVKRKNFVIHYLFIMSSKCCV